ncbi:unnamed protein product [Gongylonema pulchrum]|uniref:Secreted protein n=1 Tax=Gongylonema pulchrum TaxID=637853 RepID=A0A183EYQ5_9BILA|nr:unnamed protein product [Gongylonema pulchrum]
MAHVVRFAAKQLVAGSLLHQLKRKNEWWEGGGWLSHCGAGVDQRKRGATWPACQPKAGTGVYTEAQGRPSESSFYFSGAGRNAAAQHSVRRAVSRAAAAAALVIRLDEQQAANWRHCGQHSDALRHSSSSSSSERRLSPQGSGYEQQSTCCYHQANHDADYQQQQQRREQVGAAADSKKFSQRQRNSFLTVAR